MLVVSSVLLILYNFKGKAIFAFEKILDFAKQVDVSQMSVVFLVFRYEKWSYLSYKALILAYTQIYNLALHLGVSM